MAVHSDRLTSGAQESARIADDAATAEVPFMRRDLRREPAYILGVK